MELLPLQLTSWEKWLELHPDTLVLSNDTPYQEWYTNISLGSSSLGPEFVASIVYWDTRLTHNRLVLGVTVDQAFRAYPLDRVAASGGVVNDILANRPVVVVVDDQSVFSIAFSREINGQVLNFERTGADSLQLVDKETGSIWNLEGLAIDGPLEGESLSFVTSFITEWYGWSAYHPETEIYAIANP